MLHHVDLLGGVVSDGVGIVEPAVVGVPLFAVSQWETLVCGLGQVVTVLHFDQLEVAALPLTCVLLLSGLESSALHTVSVGEERAVWTRLMNKTKLDHSKTKI